MTPLLKIKRDLIIKKSPVVAFRVPAATGELTLTLTQPCTQLDLSLPQCAAVRVALPLPHEMSAHLPSLCLSASVPEIT